MKWLDRIFGGPAAQPVPEGPVRSVRLTANDARPAIAAAYERQAGSDVAATEAAWRAVLAQWPAEHTAQYLFGAWLATQGRAAEAVPLLQAAAAADPHDWPVQVALARALIVAGRYDDALQVCRAVHAAQPDCTELLNDYAGVLMKLDRHEEALPLLEHHRRLRPEAAEVYFNLGVIHCASGHADEAVAAYRDGLERAPRHAPAFSNLLLQMNYSARATPRSLYLEHRRFGERFAAPHAVPQPDASATRRLRVGYVSPDFREHVVMRFMEGILANHDDERFEIVCYHTHPLKDALTERLRFMAGRWVDADDLDPAALAARIRADGIDILVDLAGHTAGNSLLAMALKPAPLQLTYLGYPNTTGLATIDARISDAWADPPGDSDRYSVERIVRLPGSYFCYRPNAGTPPVNELPAARSGVVTFGCFNNLPKLSSEFLDAAAEVLDCVPRSRLLLKNRQLGIPRIAEQVREHFRRAGIDLARVSLRGWEASATDHLAIYHEVDVALDSFPYNGATTTCEALYMGVPVVSLAGDRHAGRMGSSLLNAAGLGHLVARGAEQYLTIAANLAADLPALAALRAALRAQLQASPVMDESGFTRRLEDCYLQLWQECVRERSSAELGGGSSSDRLARAQLLRSAGAGPGGDLTEASDLCHAVLRAEPDNEEALALAWDLAYEAGAPGAAIEWLNRGLAVRESPRMHYMLGCVLQSQGRLAEAANAFGKVLALDTTHARAENNLGCVHEAAGHLADAERHYRRAIDLDAQLAQAHYNLGNLQRQLGQGEAAIDSLRRALQIDAGAADWHCNLGELLAQHRQWDAAVDSLRAALGADPDHERARLALADVLLACGDAEQALNELPETNASSPWRAATDLKCLQLEQTLQPASASATLAAQRRWSERHARTVLRGPRGFSPGRRKEEGGVLHVGYLLPDAAGVAARAHVAPLLAAHDAAVVRVHGYALASRTPALETPLRSACAVWRDVSALDDAAIVQQLRADGIDVLVDLVCSGSHARPGVLARQAARVQCAWPLTAPGVVLPAAAFRITDNWTDPEGSASAEEELLRIARPAVCFQPPAAYAQVDPAPAGADAPLLFGWLGSPAELSPATWAAWAAILQSLPQSRLQLGSAAFASELARAWVRECAAAVGVDAGRLELRATDEADPAFFAAVDIALDSFPLNGLGSCAALWIGVPVVSLTGRSGAAGRAAAILAAADASEGLAASSGAYVHTAVQWAAGVAHLRAARRLGSRRVRASALTDAPALARALEHAYAAAVAS